MYRDVHCHTVYSSQGMEATQMSINRGMHKEGVVRIYNRVLLSQKRNEIIPFAETWMDLKMFMQSEVSQKEKNKYYVLMHICGI